MVLARSADPQSVQQHFTFTLWWQRLPCWEMILSYCVIAVRVHVKDRLSSVNLRRRRLRCVCVRHDLLICPLRAAPPHRVASPRLHGNGTTTTSAVDNMAEPRMERGGHTPKRVFINNTDSYASQHIAKVKIRQGSCGSEPSVGWVLART